MIHPIIEYNIQVPNKYFFFFLKSWKQHVLFSSFNIIANQPNIDIQYTNVFFILSVFFHLSGKKKTNFPKILSKRMFMIGKHIL